MQQSSVHVPPQTTSLDALPWDASRAPAPPIVPTSASNQAWETSQAEQHPGLQHAASDLDFSLIWPDSENLFQSIMSSDATDQWQMPLGALPFPPVVQDVNVMNFGSPNSFDDRGSSIGTIPSGGSHQAVRDVTEMVTSSVGVPQASWFKYPLLILSKLLVVKCHSCNQGDIDNISLFR